MGNKMGKMRDSTMSSKLLPVVGCVLVVLVCTAPCGALDVLEGETVDVDGVVDYLFVEGTANLLSGADVLGLVWVFPGGTVNIYPGAHVREAMYVEEGAIINFYGGGVGYGIYVFDGLSQPVVTVYGSYFEVDGTPFGESEFIPDPDVGSLLTGLYENDDLIDLEFYGPAPIHLVVSSVPEVVEVAIDIRPYCGKNVIDLNCKGVIPVAVLTTDVFDAATIDPATVVFADATPVCSVLKDIDRDGDKDMLFNFKTQDLNLDQDSTEATLTGQTTQGILIEGTDDVRIVPSKSKRCFFRWRPLSRLRKWSLYRPN